MFLFVFADTEVNGVRAGRAVGEEEGERYEGAARPRRGRTGDVFWLAALNSPGPHNTNC